MDTDQHSEAQLKDCPDCGGDGYCYCEDDECELCGQPGCSPNFHFL